MRHGRFVENVDKIMEKNREKKIIIPAYEKAQNVLGDEGSIDPRGFTNFDPAVIEKDLKYVADKEALFAAQDISSARDAKRFGLILEALIHEQVELNEWFGANVQTIKASRFDDIYNGIDSIAELQRDGGVSYLALAIDVTYGDPTDKIARIKTEIDNERLSEIKYFTSSDGSFQGTLKKVPRVIVGADSRTVINLAGMWIDNKQKDLAVHPVQLQLLDEIILQLQTFIKYAEAKGKNGVVEAYTKQLQLFNSIRNSPKKTAIAQQAGAQDYQTNDFVFNKLRMALENLSPR